MTGGDERRGVQIVATGVRGQRIGRGGGVEESAGITATRPVHAAIVDIPDGDAALPQIVGDPVHDRPVGDLGRPASAMDRSEEHTSELQSLMRISYAVFCLKKKTITV